MVSNGLLSQQASVLRNYDSTLAPNQQVAVFPNQITDASQFSASAISLVDPHFRFPYVLQGSLQILDCLGKLSCLRLGNSEGSLFVSAIEMRNGLRRVALRQQGVAEKLVRGDEATLKRFYREPAGKIRLQPSNSNMNPIYLPAAEVKIQGRVVGVLRKY